MTDTDFEAIVAAAKKRNPPKPPSQTIGASVGAETAAMARTPSPRIDTTEANRAATIACNIRAATLPARQMDAIRAGSPLSPEQSDVLARMMLGVGNGSPMALVGPRGSGKTHLACKLVIEFVKSTTATARYIKAMDYFREIKDTFGDGAAKRESEVLLAFRRVGLLVLDEAHDRSGSDWEQTQLTDLIDQRYFSKRPTVLITNEKRETLPKSLGLSIASRMLEGGGAFELAGENFRTAHIGGH